MDNHVQYLLDHLIAEGFQAKLDADGDIQFKREGLSYALCFDAEDPAFAKLILPNVWKMESQECLNQALLILDDINRRMKVVKGHTQRDQIWFTVEILLTEQTQWPAHLQRAIRSLSHSVTMFGEKMRAIKNPALASATSQNH